MDISEELHLQLGFGITEQLSKLFEQKPELFERINLRDYATKPFLEDLDTIRLTENGKAGWISIDNPKTDEWSTYRFYWEDVCQELTSPTQP